MMSQHSRCERLSVIVQEQSSGIGCTRFHKSCTTFAISLQQWDYLARKDGTNRMIGLSSIGIKRELPKCSAWIDHPDFPDALRKSHCQHGRNLFFEDVSASRRPASRDSRIFLCRQARTRRHFMSSALRSNMALFLTSVAASAFFRSCSGIFARTSKNTNLPCLRCLTLFGSWGGTSIMMSRTHLRFIFLRRRCRPKGGIERS